MPTTHPHTDPSKRNLIVAFALVYIIWGSTYLGIRIAIETIPPLMMLCARYLTAGLILYGWVRLRGSEAPKLVHWRSAAIVGALLLLGGNGAVAIAEQKVPSGLAALMVAITPLWMVLIDWLRPGGTRPHPIVFAGIALGLGGVVLLVGPGEIAGGGSVDIGGALTIVVGTLCWASGSIYSRTARLPSSQLLATAMEMTAGGVLLLLVSLAFGEWNHFDPAHVSARSLEALAYLIVFGSLAGFTAYIYLLGHTTTARASTYAYVNPVVAVLLGWAFGNEPLTPRTLIAAAIIIGAVMLITFYRARRSRAPAAGPAATEQSSA